jgi:hypothetical protein
MGIGGGCCCCFGVVVVAADDDLNELVGDGVLLLRVLVVLLSEDGEFDILMCLACSRLGYVK